MNIFLLGSGGREHALAWKFSQSPVVKRVYVYPGNPGMKSEKKIELIKLPSNKTKELIHFAKTYDINLTVVGPEAYLAEGIVDQFIQAGLLILGPSKCAAQIESSKSFAKKLMKEAKIPTAEFEVFEDANAAFKFIDNCKWPDGIVVKCDGLAAGKGVVVTENKESAKHAVKLMLVDDVLEINNKKIILEERMIGPEVSVFALCDGKNSIWLGDACDYKRLKDNNIGPNTGGMGTYSPADWLTPAMRQEINQKIIQPTLNKMQHDGTPFTGILFAGLMKTKDGFKVIEFNARLGDPETQSIIPLIDGDIVPYFLAAAKGQLSTIGKSLKFKALSTVHVVMSSFGYPGTEGTKVRTGDEVEYNKTYFQELEEDATAKLFFAGVSEKNQQLLTAGGRILGLTAFAKNRPAARAEVYKHLDKIKINGVQFRSDIGL
ncbi:MAG: phosphoribosylamine--glycine ligase [Bacteriovoracaceae bacterium]|nr:phosphoribosylamine--glycine ligase [Bacteriovoracaceae bacterium]